MYGGCVCVYGVCVCERVSVWSVRMCVMVCVHVCKIMYANVVYGVWWCARGVVWYVRMCFNGIYA